jgi:membrane protease YdiL (CAAX protease family)
MSQESQPIAAPIVPGIRMKSHAGDLANWIQIALVFSLIMVAVWTPQGHLNTAVSLLAAFFIVFFTIRSDFSVGDLGLSRPASGAAVMLGAGVLIAVAIGLVGSMMMKIGPARPVPWNRAWQYAIWALLQEFILQSFFYLRMERSLGSRRATLASAFLFSIAHIPSPILTVMSFLGALFFCDLFRRYRNVYPLGVIHATFGLVIAASFPDNLLHHMRVGLGYLTYRP